jgi:hypothetical protein
MANAFVTALAAEVFETLEHLSDAIYTPVVGDQITTRVAISSGIQRVGFESRLSDSHEEASLLREDVTAPKRGDTINIAGTVYELISPIIDDGVVATWLVVVQ